MIYRIAEAVDWRLAQCKGVFVSADLAAEGFIHCSERHQVARTAQKSSLALAREAYGVVFKDEQSLELDGVATEAARAEIRAARARGEGFTSLTDYYRAKPVQRQINPVSAAADKQFGRS